jgi:nucleoside-diphosphate-sugar epimerase
VLRSSTALVKLFQYLKHLPIALKSNSFSSQYVIHKNPILPPGSLILVTAANGFIGSYIVDLFLSSSYNFRGTVRDVHRQAWLQPFFNDRYDTSHFELFPAPDLTIPGVWAKAVERVTAVIHTAAFTGFNSNPHDIITPDVTSVKLAAEAAAVSDTVRRFVLTSSAFAAATARQDVGYTIGMWDFNDEIVKLAWTPPFEGWQKTVEVYGVSKTEVEKVLWCFVKEEKPRFVVNTGMAFELL